MKTESIPFTIIDYQHLVVDKKSHHIEAHSENDQMLPARIAFVDFVPQSRKEHCIQAAITRSNEDHGDYEEMTPFRADGGARNHGYRLCIVPNSLGWVPIVRTQDDTILIVGNSPYKTQGLAAIAIKDFGHTPVSLVEIFEGEGIGRVPMSPEQNITIA